MQCKLTSGVLQSLLSLFKNMSNKMQISEILSSIFNEVSGVIYGTHEKAHIRAYVNRVLL
jgi:hypothetical protein